MLNNTSTTTYQHLRLMILLGAELLLLLCIGGIQGYPLDEKDLSSGIVHSAGLLGHYAGGLTGGEALSKLDFSTSSHEFGASASEQDHLGSLGDHLSDDGFPADYSGGTDAGEEYAEASEVHSHYEEEHKAVPGIDHGKGAFSYSTLYEFKDRDEHELQHIQHQAQEQQVEHQAEHQVEHQLLDHHDHHELSHLEHLY